MDPITREVQARAEIVRIASALRLGELTAIEAAPKIVAAASSIERLLWDQDVVIFQGIASETDVHLIGDPNIGWHPDVKAQRLAEREAAETAYRPKAVQAAKRLIERFGEQGS